MKKINLHLGFARSSTAVLLPVLGKIKLQATSKERRIIMAKKNTTEEITFEIVEHLGDISIQSNGWTKELNIVKWNGGSEKYDLRSWAPELDKM